MNLDLLIRERMAPPPYDDEKEIRSKTKESRKRILRFSTFVSILSSAPLFLAAFDYNEERVAAAQGTSFSPQRCKQVCFMFRRLILFASKQAVQETGCSLNGSRIALHSVRQSRQQARPQEQQLLLGGRHMQSIRSHTNSARLPHQAHSFPTKLGLCGACLPPFFFGTRGFLVGVSDKGLFEKAGSLVRATKLDKISRPKRAVLVRKVVIRPEPMTVQAASAQRIP